MLKSANLIADDPKQWQAVNPCELMWLNTKNQKKKWSESKERWAVWDEHRSKSLTKMRISQLCQGLPSTALDCAYIWPRQTQHNSFCSVARSGTTCAGKTKSTVLSMAIALISKTEVRTRFRSKPKWAKLITTKQPRIRSVFASESQLMAEEVRRRKKWFLARTTNGQLTMWPEHKTKPILTRMVWEAQVVIESSTTAEPGCVWPITFFETKRSKSKTTEIKLKKEQTKKEKMWIG